MTPTNPPEPDDGLNPRGQHREPSLTDALADVLAKMPGWSRETAENVAHSLSGGPLDVRAEVSYVLSSDWGHPLTEEEEAPPFVALTELLSRPELLDPPKTVLPRIAYRGRMTMPAAPEKAGKSTFLAHGAAALSAGRPFLGEPILPGRVLWVGLEEAVGDGVRRFGDLEADPTRIMLFTHAPRDLYGALRSIMAEWRPDLIVVDSLAEYARVVGGKAPDSGDSAGWGAVIRPLVALVREYDSAGVVLHHASKATGQYRDSSEIGAAVDAILEMSLPTSNEDPSIRHIRGRGRWRIDPFDVVLRDGQYDLADGAGDLSLDALLIIHVEQNPGISGNDLVTKVGRNKKKVLDTLRQLTDRGALEYRDGYRPPSPQHDLEVI